MSMCARRFRPSSVNWPKDRVMEEPAAAMDAAEPDAGPAIDALLRILDAGERVAGRHEGLLRAIAAPPDPRRALHTTLRRVLAPPR